MFLFALAFALPPVRRACVLLVEDHQDTRQNAEYLQLFFDVIEAADAHEALSLARQYRPDIVVTDLSLPGMEGLELIARLRTASATSRTPMITLSGYGEDRSERPAGREPGNERPAERALLKPCLPDALAAAITELLGDARPRSARS